MCALVAASLLPGCFLDRSGAGSGADAGPPTMDSGRADAGGGAADSGAEDGGETVDEGLEDAGNEPRSDGGVDAGVDGGVDAGFDGGVDAGFDAGFDAGVDAGPPSCDALYGSASGYILCVETPTECEFYTTLDRVRTCESTCADFGGSCLRRWRDENGAGNECVRMDSSSRRCDTTGNRTDICVCTRP